MPAEAVYTDLQKSSVDQSEAPSGTTAETEDGAVQPVFKFSERSGIHSVHITEKIQHRSDACAGIDPQQAILCVQAWGTELQKVLQIYAGLGLLRPNCGKCVN